MQGVYHEESDEIFVTLSYDNVRDLYAALDVMGAKSRNVFTLSKQQVDGPKVTVAVTFEQAKRDWEGR